MLNRRVPIWLQECWRWIFRWRGEGHKWGPFGSQLLQLLHWWHKAWQSADFLILARFWCIHWISPQAEMMPSVLLDHVLPKIQSLILVEPGSNYILLYFESIRGDFSFDLFQCRVQFLYGSQSQRVSFLLIGKCKKSCFSLHFEGEFDIGVQIPSYFCCERFHRYLM